MTWRFRRPCMWFIDFLEWNGWTNANTYLFGVCAYGRYNWGLTILPLCGWKYLRVEWRTPRERQKYIQGRWVALPRPNKRRLILGLWFFEIFFDHPWYEGNPG